MIFDFINTIPRTSEGFIFLNHLCLWDLEKSWSGKNCVFMALKIEFKYYGTLQVFHEFFLILSGEHFYKLEFLLLR